MSQWTSPPRRVVEPDPEAARLKSIAGDLRLIGVLFILLGVLATLAATAAAFGARGAWPARLLLMSSLFMLLLPGAWFAVAASLVTGGRGGLVVRWSLGVACLQAIATIATLAMALSDARGRFMNGPSAIPVMLLVFFIPAQAALLAQLVRARGLINAREARRGFAAEAAIATAQLLVAQAVVDAAAADVPVADVATSEARR